MERDGGAPGNEDTIILHNKREKNPSISCDKTNRFIISYVSYYMLIYLPIKFPFFILNVANEFKKKEKDTVTKLNHTHS